MDVGRVPVQKANKRSNAPINGLTSKLLVRAKLQVNEAQPKPRSKIWSYLWVIEILIYNELVDWFLQLKGINFHQKEDQLSKSLKHVDAGWLCVLPQNILLRVEETAEADVQEKKAKVGGVLEGKGRIDLG